MEINLAAIHSVIRQYFPLEEKWQITPLTNGLINDTYKIYCSDKIFILQQLNTAIFKEPQATTHNIQLLAKYLKNKDYPYDVVDVIPSIHGDILVSSEEKSWRLLTFIRHGKTINCIENAAQAEAAAKAFGAFYSATSDFDTNKLKASIQAFTDFSKRIYQFQQAILSASNEKKEIAKAAIQTCIDKLPIIHKYISIEKTLPTRLLHADPKISNVLFDNKLKKVKAIIDLDTLQPGSILYDYGDMIRSFTNQYSEDNVANDLFSKAYYKAAKKGFLYNMSEVLSNIEINHLDLAPKAVTLVQAMRFLTDYLQNDIYYKISYPMHNLDRAKNQILLLDAMQQQL